MKTTRRVSFTLLIVVTFCDSVFALDPSAFLKILGIGINGITHATGDLTIVKQELGDAKRIDTGDAAEYVGRVEYILDDGSQSIVFKTGECFEGYTIERIDPYASHSSQTVLKPSIKTISVDGLKLCMDRKDVEKLFSGPIMGGWTLAEEKKELDTLQIAYQKGIVLGRGENFCDRIDIRLHFDARSGLNRMDVLSQGCMDAPCRDE